MTNDKTQPPTNVTRRSFLKGSGVLASAPLLAGLPASSVANVIGANDLIQLGWIGVGGRGSSLLGRALNSVSVSSGPGTAAETVMSNALCVCARSRKETELIDPGS